MHQSFCRDCQKRMTELRGMFEVPERRMGRIRAHRSGRAIQARSERTGKTQMRFIYGDGMAQRVDVRLIDLHSLQKTFDREQFAEPPVGCFYRFRVEGKICLPGRKQSHVEQIGHHEVPGAGQPEKSLNLGNFVADLRSQPVRRP